MRCLSILFFIAIAVFTLYLGTEETFYHFKFLVIKVFLKHFLNAVRLYNQIKIKLEFSKYISHRVLSFKLIFDRQHFFSYFQFQEKIAGEYDPAGPIPMGYYHRGAFLT